jgi:hypothetical protein
MTIEIISWYGQLKTSSGWLRQRAGSGNGLDCCITGQKYSKIVMEVISRPNNSKIRMNEKKLHN